MGILNRIKEVIKTIRFSASPRLYGRFSSGAGDGEEILLGTNLSMSGNTLNAASTTSIAWENVTGKPATFTPSTHTHAISDITGLQSSLDSKATIGAVAIPAADINWLSGSVFTKTLSGNTTLTFSNTVTGKEIHLNISCGATAYGINWPATVTWVNLSTPPFPSPNTTTRFRFVATATGVDGFYDSFTIPLGPYANDAAAASGGVAVGFLYYTAAGAVLRRMS